MSSKTHLREILNFPSQSGLHGKLAQSCRRISSYHHCKIVFISPAPILAQIRINALLDGKDLIMPGPSLEQGFYLLKAFSVPFKELVIATSFKGLTKYGTLISHSQLESLGIDYLVSDAVAVDRSGNRLGDGQGFFDLSCAILNHYQALSKDVRVLAVVDDMKRLVDEELPNDTWDVPVQGVVCPDGFVEFGGNFIAPQIDWQCLPIKRIRKISLLWKVYADGNQRI